MICIINCGTTYLDAIKKHLNELGYPSKVIDLEEIEGCDFGSFSGIIITGAPTLLTQVDLQKYMELFEFIKTVNIPILGICLGHQIMGVLYGSKIDIGKMINKKERIEIVKEDGLFSNIENQSLFQEEHSEYITLPEGFHLLAKSESCENEAMKHKNKAMYGIQFHPEVSGDNGKQVLKNFLNMCPKK
ncbi:MAG: gamma-glutamyl-gamma-aminobutyrate hydrolase family protein [Candidatus Aenigmarchaeota archaeon]|nr:gamma-glutamyl-gamma-aminobutyrate hydrolase family protein [Candidatus Aenigmarchaeota archaeon]